VAWLGSPLADIGYTAAHVFDWRPREEDDGREDFEGPELQNGYPLSSEGPALVFECDGERIVGRWTRLGDGNDDEVAVRQALVPRESLAPQTVLPTLASVVVDEWRWFFTPLCELGSLERILDNGLLHPGHVLREDGACRVLQCTLRGLAWLSKMKTGAHGRVHPKAIFLCRDGSTRLGELRSRRESAPDLWFSPPDDTTPDGGFVSGFKGDVWSLGIVAHTLLIGDTPHNNLPPMRAMGAIFHNPSPELPESVSAPLRQFVSKMLVKNHVQRASVDQLLEDPFLEGVDENALCPVVARITGSAQVKSARKT
jgi:serine/threonine protein kinase